MLKRLQVNRDYKYKNTVSLKIYQIESILNYAIFCRDFLVFPITGQEFNIIQRYIIKWQTSIDFNYVKPCLDLLQL